MIRFPPVDAALEGFRITREQPLAVAAWAGVLIAVNLLGQVWLASTGLGASVAALQAITPQTSPDQVMQAMGGGGPGLVLLALAGMAIQVVLYTAVLRSVLQPAERRFGYLRLGVDELRQFGLILIIFVAFTLYLFAATLISGLVIAVTGAAPPLAGGLLRALVVAALFVAILYPVVRLSLAPSMTFAEKRLTLLRSWSLTKGQFWGLFGAYVLAGVLAILVALLAFIIFGAVAASVGLASGGRLDVVAAATARHGLPTLDTLFEPTNLILLLFSAFWSTLVFTLINAVAPAAFRHLAGRTGAAMT